MKIRGKSGRERDEKFWEQSMHHLCLAKMVAIKDQREDVIFGD